MQAYIGIFVLCVVSGAIACAINVVCNKNKLHISDIIKTFAFYVIVFYTVLSLFKALLGYGLVNLAASFNDVSWKTYLHYSLPLIVISVVMPLLLKKLLGEKVSDFINLTLSINIGIYAVVYLIFGKNNNLLTVCIEAVSVVMALIIVFCYKKEVQYCTGQNVKSRLAIAVPVVLFWTIMMVLFLPNELYISNANEMIIPYRIFNRTLILGAMAYFVIYTVVLVYFLSERQFALVCELIFAITAAGYLQRTILNGKINVMDGSRQTWSALTVVVNAVIWLAIISVLIALKYIIKRNVDKVYSMICIYLSVIQLVTLGYMVFTTKMPDSDAELMLTTDKRFELNPDHNVIVFILDWYDVQIMDKILEDDADFLEPLNDFTWYKNVTSSYAFTMMSIPYLLSDVEWPYEMNEKEYRDYAFQGEALIKDIAAKNYDVGIYTNKSLVSESVADIVTNYSDLKTHGWDYYGMFNQMVKCSKYDTYPFALKNEFWYTSGQISSGFHDTSVHSIANDQPFYEELIGDGIQVRNIDKYDGTFRFYHLLGAHPPYETDMLSQGKWCISIIYEFIEQLKAEGLYDEAAIIITADHGQNYIAPGYEDQLLELGLDYTSSPILFVKNSYQTNEDGMNISMAPVSHAQLAATIMQAVCGDSLGYGETIEDIEEDRPCKREFIMWRSSDVPYIKYEIDGYAGDWNNWSVVTENE